MLVRFEVRLHGVIFGVLKGKGRLSMGSEDHWLGT